MNKLIFATGNQAKLLDASKALSELGIEIIGQKIEIEEIQSLDQEEIIMKKAKKAFEMVNLPLFVDDTGFYLDSYPQFPGTLTKYVNKTLGINGLSKLFEEGQTAHFKTLLCLITSDTVVIAEGKLSGKLTKKMSSNFNPDTPINSIFVPEGYNKPLIDLIENSNIGNLHRTRAFVDLGTKIKTLQINLINDSI